MSTKQNRWTMVAAEQLEPGDLIYAFGELHRVVRVDGHTVVGHHGVVATGGFFALDAIDAEERGRQLWKGLA